MFPPEPISLASSEYVLLSALNVSKSFSTLTISPSSIADTNSVSFVSTSAALTEPNKTNINAMTDKIAKMLKLNLILSLHPN